MSALFICRGLKPLLFILPALLLSACVTTPSGMEPVKSQNDDYSYRLLTLDNEMEVLLVSDPDSPKAAAALAVQVGSGDNPADREGLAHFLEHMLFLGTEKYPNAAEYEEFITEHGGNRNAYTSFEQTNYFFDINAQHLPEALDRFGQFFIAPKFDSAYVDREKNAVQAEYQMGLKSDSRRGLDVLQEVMNPQHSFSQFSVGSLETLEDRPNASIRDDLLSYYDKHYSANVMRLVVFGAHTLDELEAMARPLFSQVPNKSFAYDVMPEPLFEPDAIPMLVQVKPQATLRTLELFFPVADYRKNYRENPLVYLGNLMGHEGEGSLLSQLKVEGLAESLGAGTAIGWRGGSLFSVEITLTEKGVDQYNRVLQLLFAYTDMLRAEGPKGWMYEESAQLSRLRFRYKEHGSPMGYVSALASGMLEYAPEDTLRGPYMMERYDAQMLTDMLAMIEPENALVVLSHADAKTDIVSDRYQVEYSRNPLDVQKLSVAANDSGVQALHLPVPNEFITTDVSLVRLPPKIPAIPEIAVQRERQTIWYMPDDKFRLPKGSTFLNFRSPDIGANASNTLRASLYTAVLVDQVNEFSYPARLAGLNFSFYRHAQGISLRMSGYTEKQSLLLERLLADIRAPEFDPQRFENIRQDMIRSLKNSVAKRPSQQIMDDLAEALLHGQWGEEAAIAVLEDTSMDDLKAYITAFWESASVEGLVYGNYEAKSVESLSALLDTVVASTPAPAVPLLEVVKLEAATPVQFVVDIPHDDSVTAWYLQGEGISWKDRAVTALTAQIMSSGFFQQLRTEQQLGYIVSAFSWAKHDVPGLVMLVQSPVADASAVVQSMEEFMSGVQPNLDAAQFERHKVALVSEILRPDKNLSERAEFYWQSIARKRFAFASREDFAEAVQALSLQDWQAYFERVFMQERHSLQMVSPGSFDVRPPLNGAQRVDSADAIKSSRDSYQMPQAQ